MSHEAIEVGFSRGAASCPSTRLSANSRPRSFCWAVWPDIRAIEVFPAPFQPLEVTRDGTEAASEIEILRAPGRLRSGRCEASRRDPDHARDAEPADSVDAQHDADPVRTDPSLPSSSRRRCRRHRCRWRKSAQNTRPRVGGTSRPRSRNRSRPSSTRGLHQRRSRRVYAPGRSPCPARLTAVLPAVGPLAIEVQVVDGVTLLTATSPAVDGEVAVSVAALLLPLLRPGRTPWPVDQVTLRGPRAVLILTPLGRCRPAGRCSRPPSRGRRLALLELLCRQAAAAQPPVRAPRSRTGSRRRARRARLARR